MLLLVLAVSFAFLVYHVLMVRALCREYEALRSRLDALLAERRSRVEADVRRDIKMAPPMDRRGSFVRH